MSGDLNLYTPGTEVTVNLVADAAGEVPERGDGVALNGSEDSAHPEAENVSAAGDFVGSLVDLPPDVDDEDIAGLSPGDSLGLVNVRVTHYVEWLPSDDATLSPGDLAVYGADGVVAYDVTPHEPNDIIGRVFKTGSNELGTDGKVAVVRTA